MSFAITDDEFRLVSGLPVQELVELAIELDILVPEEIDRRALVSECVVRIVDRGRKEGLPFSKYDREDLARLSPAELAAIAELQGLRPSASVRSVLKAGQKVYKTYSKTRPNSAVALSLPILLRAVARAAREGHRVD